MRGLLAKAVWIVVGLISLAAVGSAMKNARDAVRAPGSVAAAITGDAGGQRPNRASSDGC